MSSREMGSFFYRQAMENAHGDLTEIVRENNGGGGGGGSDSSCGPINYHLMSTDMLPNFEESSMTTNSSSSASLPVKPSLPLCSPDRVTGVKRRKGQAKKVICIPAPQTLGDQESNKSGSGGSVIVPSDLWAWRKYGQKPIKGSPYPRGYYRCSSSKGCPARKQVERSHSDPNMLVITYTSEHNHAWPTQRNSLAGSTRSQHSKTQNITTSTPNTPTTIARNQSPPPSTSMLEPNVTIKEETLNFDQIFDQSFAPLDLFDDFGGLDPDPMSFFLSSEEEGNNRTLMDPLSLNFFDWDGN